MFYGDPVKELLNAASIACEHIIRAARDVKYAKRDVFPTDVYVEGKKQVAVTELELLRNKLDYEHVQVSSEWLNRIEDDQRDDKREKLKNGLQSIAWFSNTGYPLISFEECCRCLNEGLKLVNNQYRKTSGCMISAPILAEKIHQDPKEMLRILEAVRSQLHRGTIKDYKDEILDELNTDFEYAVPLSWNDCHRVVPVEIEDDDSIAKAIEADQKEPTAKAS
tara:strand:+ start:701 stop:1366 length:666 start_codon:yes stop_codon:yes gene_type:complete